MENKPVIAIGILASLIARISFQELMSEAITTVIMATLGAISAMTVKGVIKSIVNRKKGKDEGD